MVSLVNPFRPSNLKSGLRHLVTTYGAELSESDAKTKIPNGTRTNPGETQKLGDSENFDMVISRRETEKVIALPNKMIDMT